MFEKLKGWSIIAEESGAPWVSKSGNLSIREILVLTSAYVRPYRLWGRGREVPRQPNGGRGMPSFLGGKSHDHRRFWKKSLSVFSKTIAWQYWSFKIEKKRSNIYKWKEKVQKNTQLSFWGKAKSSRYETIFLGIQSSLFCSRLRTRYAHRLGLPPRGEEGGGGHSTKFSGFFFSTA